MNALKKAICLMACAAVTACAPASDPRALVETAKTEASITAEELSVAGIYIRVPESLKVSEANSYYPGGDIVWRGDPIGDRHAQVKAIFETAFSDGAARLDGTRPVHLHVTVDRFHALTDKARYTVGGVHAITFRYQLIDAETRDPLADPKRVFADLKAFGGAQAVEAENQGITQKTRITAHLADVLVQELMAPGGHETVKLGALQVLNKF